MNKSVVSDLFHYFVYVPPVRYYLSGRWSTSSCLGRQDATLGGGLVGLIAHRELIPIVEPHGGLRAPRRLLMGPCRGPWVVEEVSDQGIVQCQAS